LPAHWAFRIEDAEEKAVPDEEVNNILRTKPVAIYSNQNRQNLAREQRKLGRCEEVILIGNYIAFTPNYLPSVKKKQRQEFWLGKVIEIHAKSEKVNVLFWHTPVLKNASSKNNNAKYRVFTGGRTAKTSWRTGFSFRYLN
jgi:hypothetical protein